MRATQHFHCGLLLMAQRKKFQNKNEKNYLHGKAPNKQKKNENLFGFSFNDTTKQTKR